MSKEIHILGNSAFLSQSNSIVMDSLDDALSQFTVDKSAKTTEIKPIAEKNTGIGSKTIKFVEWGEENNLPLTITKRIQNNIQLGANTDFNVRSGYGQGILVVKKIKENGEVKYEEQLESEQPEVFEFIKNNNYDKILYDSMIDLDIFNLSYRELIFSLSNKIVQIRHKEATYSRVSQMNSEGVIEYHGYNYEWHNNKNDNVSVTKLLNEEAPLFDLKMRRGLIENQKGKKEIEKDTFRYMLAVGTPTPARVYYPSPFYWAVFRMQWDSIANLIPQFKTALMKNKIQIAYIISINKSFWEKLYSWDNACTDEEQTESKKKFLLSLDEFLAGSKNSGKGFVQEFEYNGRDGQEFHDIKIEPLKKSYNQTEGGDWIEDNEEATNMICLSKLNHVSLIGASPGKNSKINGIEARELFIIKQSMMQPVRNELVKDLYIVKEINGWDKDLHFVIPNIQLTTLDKNTGSVKQIGSQQI